MNCMKCGRDIEEGQVFCGICLEEMGKYPVKPGTAVQLPNRKETPILKKVLVKRRPATPEEQVIKLRKRLQTLFLMWILTLLLLAATIYPTVEFIFGKQAPQPGQNYSTITDANRDETRTRTLP